LHKRYSSLAVAGKDQRKIVTAVGRELLGYIWAIGIDGRDGRLAAHGSRREGKNYGKGKNFPKNGKVKN